MKILRLLFLSIAFLTVMTTTALVTAGFLHNPSVNSAEVKDISTGPRGGCSMVVNLDGTNVVIDESNPATCASLEVGDRISF